MHRAEDEWRGRGTYLAVASALYVSKLTNLAEEVTELAVLSSQLWRKQAACVEVE